MSDETLKPDPAGIVLFCLTVLLAALPAGDHRARTLAEREER